LLPSDWVERAFTPYMKSSPSLTTPNYGWSWWRYDYGANGGKVIVADGWRGQRIVVSREKDFVLTMTGDILAQNEAEIFFRVMSEFVFPSVQRGSSGDQQALIDAAIARVRSGSPRFSATTNEARMIPSASPKAQAIPFRP
jgi:hypothetical protein